MGPIHFSNTLTADEADRELTFDELEYLGFDGTCRTVGQPVFMHELTVSQAIKLVCAYQDGVLGG